MTEDETSSPEEKLFKAGMLRGRDSLDPYMPGLGWLDFDAGVGARHVDLPSDLFTVSLQCEEGSSFDALLAVGLHVVISPVRVWARRFSVVGRAKVAVATLTPLGMLSAFGGDATRLADVPIPLTHLCGRMEERRLAYALRAARSVHRRVEVFGQWLEERIFGSRGISPSTMRVANAAMTLVGGPPQLFGVLELADRFGVTRRQLERDFRGLLGVSPAAYGRLVRFQRAAASVAAGHPLLHAAVDHGFADQSHMNRAFQEFAGVTPGDVARDGARPGRDLLRAGLGGRVFVLDAGEKFSQTSAIQLEHEHSL
jgi:AraC-like DNA-binding protein